MTKYFGTDGIRQKADDFTPDFIQTVTSGLIRYAGTARESESGAERPLRVLVGGDTRESTEWILNDFEVALETVGVEHASVGVLPTPAINYAFFEMGFDLAIDVTASHNPYTDNGIKIFERGDAIGGLEAAMPGGVNFKGTGANSKGEDLSGNQQSFNFGVKLSQHGVNSIENALESETGFTYTSAVEYAENLHEDALDRYINHLKNYVNAIGSKASAKHDDLDLTGYKIGLDCANGATSVAAEQVFKSFGAEVTAINTDANYGTGINNNCGSTHLDALIDLVKTNQLDFGAAFDGDGDRCLLIDRDGSVIDGDEIIAAVANYFGLPKIATTVMANQGLLEWCKKHEIETEITPVGDANVFKAMVEKKILVGGEQSGHIILPGQPMGDGILTALVMSKILSEARRAAEQNDNLVAEFENVDSEVAPNELKPEDISLKTVCGMTKMPEVLVNVEISREAKLAFEDEKHPVHAEIDKLNKEFAEKSWRLLVRPSGTENLLRVSIWGDDQAKIDEAAKRIADDLKTKLEA